MDFTGHIAGRSIDFDTREILLTLRVDRDSQVDNIEFTTEDKLAIRIAKWRKKRSLDANAYLWVLCTKIASALKSSKDEVYEQMLKRYGTFYRNDDGSYITVTVKKEVDMSKISGHWMHCGDDPNGKFTAYMMIKGSSEYDTKEMSDLLEGIVSEARELGIQTETDKEHQAMIEEWGKQYAKAREHHD